MQTGYAYILIATRLFSVYTSAGFIFLIHVLDTFLLNFTLTLPVIIVIFFQEAASNVSDSGTVELSMI